MPRLRDSLAGLRNGENVEDSHDDAELVLRDVERVMRRMVARGEGDVLNGDGNEDIDDDKTNDQQSQTEKSKLTALAIAAYQPRLTQPLWDHRVGKDGHLITPDIQEKIVVNDGDIIWWLTTVYYYVSLSLLGVLVLAYSFVFTSIALNRLS